MICKDDILKVVISYFSKKENVNISTNKESKIRVSVSCFYSIIIFYNNRNINIKPYWKFGLIGSVLFKNKHLEMEKNCSELKELFLEKGYCVSQLYSVSLK